MANDGFIQVYYLDHTKETAEYLLENNRFCTHSSAYKVSTSSSGDDNLPNDNQEYAEPSPYVPGAPDPSIHHSGALPQLQISWESVPPSQEVRRQHQRELPLPHRVIVKMRTQDEGTRRQVPPRDP